MRIGRLSDLCGLFVVAAMAITIRPIFQTLALRVFVASVLRDAGTISIRALKNRRQALRLDLDVFCYHLHGYS